MNTPMQGADWSVMHQHLPYFAAMLFSLPPISFVLIKVGLATRSASKQKATKQWHVEPSCDEAENAFPSALPFRTQSPSQRGVHDLLRSIEMMRAEDVTEVLEPAEAPVIESVTDGEADAVITEPLAAVEVIEPLDPAVDAEAMEPIEPMETVESVDAFEMLFAPIESIDTVEGFETMEPVESVEITQPIETPVIDAKPVRPCRSHRTSSRTSRSAEDGRRRAGSRRRR